MAEARRMGPRGLPNDSSVDQKPVATAQRADEQASAHESQPRQHHYVGQFQLKKFADDEGLLSVYDRQTEKYSRLPPKVVAVETDLYAFVDKDGEKYRAVESAIMGMVDGPVRVILERLDAGERLSDDERLELALFVSFQRTRVPSTRELLTQQIEKAGRAAAEFACAEPARLAAFIRKYEEQTGQKTDVKPEELAEAILSRGKANPAYVLRLMVEFGLAHAPLVASLNWRVLIARSAGRFVLSDHPFVVVSAAGSDDGAGLMTPGAVKYLPLTPRCCLEMGDPGASFGFSRIDRAFVRRINMNTARNSRRFVMGGSREHLQSVVERAGVQRAGQEDLAHVRAVALDGNSQLIRISSRPLARRSRRQDGRAAPRAFRVRKLTNFPWRDSVRSQLFSATTPCLW
jgi:hypothetical protein